MSHPLSATVLSGFLGAGKTMLLDHVLTNCKDKRVAVIVNNLSDTNIDTQLMGGDTATSTQLSHTDEYMIELSNSCIYCMLREDLFDEIVRLAREDRFGYLLIESTGVAGPLPIAETLTFKDAGGDVLPNLVHLDTMVTVINTQRFLTDYDAANFLSDRGQARDEDGDRIVVGLLTKQIEFCDVVVLNRTDLASDAGRERLTDILHSLSPQTCIVPALFGAMPLDEILNTYRFDFDAASAVPAWLAKPYDEHVPKTEALSIGGFVYRRCMSFHPQCLWNLIHAK